MFTLLYRSRLFQWRAGTVWGDLLQATVQAAATIVLATVLIGWQPVSAVAIFVGIVAVIPAIRAWRRSEARNSS